jgi:hypothetical protein
VDQIQQDFVSIAFFYCSRNSAEPERSHATDILKCMVRQLSQSVDGHTIRAPLLGWYERKLKQAEGRDPPRPDIEECVQLMIALLEDKPAFIVLDALDECDLSTQHLLLDALSTVMSKSSCPLKIAISSRDQIDPRFSSGNSSNLYISARENGEDIKRYVETEVRRAISTRRLLNGKVSEGLKTEILKALDNRADGM